MNLDARIENLLSLDRNTPDKQLPISEQVKQLIRDVLDEVTPTTDELTAETGESFYELTDYEKVLARKRKELGL